MNKLYSFLVTLVTLFSSLSLSLKAQTRIGVQAGMNYSNLYLVDEAKARQHTDALPRFQIGLTVDIPVASDLYLQPAALYMGKGFKQDGGWLAGPAAAFKAKVHYITLPVTMLYRPQAISRNIFVGAGPYVGYGTGGRWESESQIIIGDIVHHETNGEVIFRPDVNEGEFANYLFGKPWDYGANLIFGYAFFSDLRIQANAQLGLANLTPTMDGQRPAGSARNKSYGITLGYRL